MARSVRKKIQNKKRKHVVIVIVFLLAAVGIGLYRLPPSLLGIDRIIQLAADKFSTHSADVSSAEPVLRGTVFDRNFNELAVSYQLYSLFVRSVEITDHEKVIETLVQLAGVQETDLETSLKQSTTLIKVAENLDEKQAAEIDSLQLAGVYIKPLEERFYPEHETAGGLIGYAEEGIGLAGIEATFDTVLQHGEFRSVALPEVDFQGFNVKGNSRLDLVLTLDLEIQKTVDEQLRHYLKVSGAAKGLALLMDARTGAVIAWSRQPSFNPNYFWQAKDITHADMFSEVIDDKLYRRLLISGAAVYRSGEQSPKLLPATVAAVDYGLGERELREYGQLIGLYEDMRGRLTPGNKTAPGENEAVQSGDEHKNVNGLQLITAVASMVNGGWRTTPFILDSVFDGAQKSFYTRSKEFDAKRRRRILSPSMGIMLRRNLGRENQVPGKDFFLYTDSVARIVKQGGMGRYIMQDMVIGAMPAKFPEMIMLMVAQRDHLNPLPKGLKKSSVKLVDLGRKLMPLIYASASQKVQRDYPVGLNSANYNQFLISHRIDFKGGSHATGEKGPVMPTVKGLSLRKGLQRLNGYNLQVRVEGSGRIIAQQPVPGKPLYDVGECVLFLESKI